MLGPDFFIRLGGVRHLVEIERYPDRLSADLARAHLSAHGIAAMVIESASFDPMLSAATGGVRLAVSAKHADEAKELLRTLDAPRDDDDPAFDHGVDVRCPVCESEYVFFEHAQIRHIPGLATLAGPFARLSQKRWRCRDCGGVWDRAEQGNVQRTYLPEGEPKPVFRLARSSVVPGTLIGFTVGLFALTVASGPGLAVFVLSTAAGAVLGFGRKSHVCSLPGCRNQIPITSARCTRCGGKVHGTIEDASEHFSRAAVIRRELASQQAKVTYRLALPRPAQDNQSGAAAEPDPNRSSSD